jgi:hypothetical protein
VKAERNGYVEEEEDTHIRPTELLGSSTIPKLPLLLLLLHRRVGRSIVLHLKLLDSSGDSRLRDLSWFRSRSDVLGFLNRRLPLDGFRLLVGKRVDGSWSVGFGFLDGLGEGGEGRWGDGFVVGVGSGFGLGDLGWFGFGDLEEGGER